MFSYQGTGSRHQGKGTSHTRAEQATSGLVDRRSFNQPAICQRNILDIRGSKRKSRIGGDQ